MTCDVDLDCSCVDISFEREDDTILKWESMVW